MPFAAFCFARFGDTPLHLLQQTYSAGGDTDSIGAIVGAWAGARGGPQAFPAPLLTALHDGPFGPTHLRALAVDLSNALETFASPRSTYSPLAAMARNLALFPVILAHGLRRLFP